jgi:hypothetical protein
MKADEEKIRRILKDARACVHRCQGPQAVAHLNSIRREIEDFVGEPIWAEYALVWAGALGAMTDPTAPSAFQEAFDRVFHLPDPDPELRMLAYRDYGKYLAEQLAFPAAREQYRLAEKIAETLDHSEEELAHLQLCLIGIELQETRDPHLRHFQSLKRAAAIEGATNRQQLQAWFGFIDAFQSDARPMLAARTARAPEPSVDYFRGVLSQIKRGRSEADE